MGDSWQANPSRPKREDEDPHGRAHIVPANIMAQYPTLIDNAPLRDESNFIAPNRHFQSAPMLANPPGAATGNMQVNGPGIQGALGARGTQITQEQRFEDNINTNSLGHHRPSIWNLPPLPASFNLQSDPAVHHSPGPDHGFPAPIQPAYAFNGLPTVQQPSAALAHEFSVPLQNSYALNGFPILSHSSAGLTRDLAGPVWQIHASNEFPTAPRSSADLHHGFAAPTQHPVVSDDLQTIQNMSQERFTQFINPPVFNRFAQPSTQSGPSHTSTQHPHDSNHIQTIQNISQECSSQFNNRPIFNRLAQPGTQSSPSHTSNADTHLQNRNTPFRPSAMINPYARMLRENPTQQEIARRVAAGVSPNYRGDYRLAKNRPADIPLEENCSIWMSNLPRDVTVRQLLSSIPETGRVWATVVSPPSAQHNTAAAKITFFEPAAAQALLARVNGPGRVGILVGDRLAVVRPDRNPVAAATSPPHHTRVITIAGPRELVTEEYLGRFFSNHFHYQVDEVITLVQGRVINILEWRFGSYRCQAHWAWRNISEDPFLQAQGVRVQFERDPCDW